MIRLRSDGEDFSDQFNFRHGAILLEVLTRRVCLQGADDTYRSAG